MNLGTQIKIKINNFFKIISVFTIIFLFFINMTNAKTIIGALDKVSGKVSKLIVEDDNEIFFGSIKISVKTCIKSPPTEPPENKAFIEIWDTKFKKKQEIKKIFSGWMFSSSPSISSLEHAVYDVWIIDCKVS